MVGRQSPEDRSNEPAASQALRVTPPLLAERNRSSVSMPVMRRYLHIVGFLACALPAFGVHGHGAAAGPLGFRVWLDPAVGSQPVSGRLIVFITGNPEPLETIEPSFSDETKAVWVTAREVQLLKPGESVAIDPGDIEWPVRTSQAPLGNLQVMAVLDVDHNAAYSPLTSGDFRSAVSTIAFSPTEPRLVDLRLTERIDENPRPLPEGQVLLDFESLSLSTFWGRSVHMRGALVTPPGYASTKQRYPVAYLTHGFGATRAQMLDFVGLLQKQMAGGKLPPMIWVLLDQSCPLGTHEFVDSVNNGPWGHALTRELIPYLERTYRMDGRARGRLLNGHSSGGWATLWLQVRYPEIFGGTWSTSPDPVDFRSFVNVDLTTATNLFEQIDGSPVPLVRFAGRDVESVRQFAGRETVLGDYGGQMNSFEAVFSPRGADGRPMPLFDRRTGAINRTVADYWLGRFDISRLLTSKAKELTPMLRGKIHVIVGTADTFYLDRAVRLMERAIDPFGYGAKFTYLEGRDHFNLYDGDVLSRIAGEMYDVARPRNGWKPSVGVE
jgi:pimeloyl-ACP methyl ester carboxylesterase